MALTPSGTISMSDINTALNRSSTASISFNDTQVRFLANQDTGSVIINNMRNKQSTVGTITVGFYDDGKEQYAGYAPDFAIGSISSNSYFGSAVAALYTDVINQFDAMENSGTNTTISSRLKVSSPTPLTKAMTRSSPNQYRNLATPNFFSAANSGQTWTFQFAQT